MLCDSLGLSQTRVAEYLQMDKSAVSRLLSVGGTSLTVDHLEQFAPLIQRRPSELVAEQDAEVVVVSPVEARLLSRAREMTERQRTALLEVVDWQRFEPRRQRARTPRDGVDAEVLMLFHALDGDHDAQSAVMAVLRSHANANHARPLDRRVAPAPRRDS